MARPYHLAVRLARHDEWIRYRFASRARRDRLAQGGVRGRLQVWTWDDPLYPRLPDASRSRTPAGKKACPYCGRRIVRGAVACMAHRDLPALEPFDDRYIVKP